MRARRNSEPVGSISVAGNTDSECATTSDAFRIIQVPLKVKHAKLP